MFIEPRIAWPESLGSPMFPPSSSTSLPTAYRAESAYLRSYFYVGGQYVDDGKGTGERVFIGQMYVEQLKPISAAKQPWPVVFIHGAGQTGTVSAHRI